MKYFPYKAGHVSSGNWSWAVGRKSATTPRPLQIATMNHHACRSTERGAEGLAQVMAQAASLPDNYINDVVECLRERVEKERSAGEPDFRAISLIQAYERLVTA